MQADLTEAIKSLGNPEELDLTDLNWYINEVVMYLTEYRYKLLSINTIDVNSDYNTLKVALFYNEDLDLTIGLHYRVNLNSDTTNVYPPSYMEKKVTIKYIQGKDVVN